MKQKLESTHGTLYIVALPIGNLDDISFRAISCLKKSDLILAEDTRSFGLLKKHFRIETQATSFHEQNENSKLTLAIKLLKEGKNISLVSEAGTPLISDPGFKLVKTCRQEDIPVSPIPGPSACISALSASGLESDQFLFLGFLPTKESKKRTLINEYLKLNITLICYESPYRIEKTLDTINELAPDRPICVAKEITKIYEDFFLGSASAAKDYLVSNNKIKGEFCLIIGKIPKNKSTLLKNELD